MELRPYLDQNFPARHRSPLPPDRVAAQPWLVCGALLVSPFPSRPGDGVLSQQETEAIAEMGVRLEHDRAAGRLPDCTTFWFNFRPMAGARH
jgi:hypothetical protein